MEKKELLQDIAKTKGLYNSAKRIMGEDDSFHKYEDRLRGLYNQIRSIDKRVCAIKNRKPVLTRVCYTYA